MEENSTHHRKSKKLIVLHNLMGPDSEITEEQYQSNKARIDEIREAQVLCENCNGKDCAQFNKGYMPIFKCFCGQYEMSLYPCPHSELVSRKGSTQTMEKQSNIPLCYAKLTFRDLRKMDLPEPIRKIAISVYYLATKPELNEGIYLYGPSGVGKTLLASLLGNSLLKAGKKVLFCTTAELLTNLKANIKGNWKETFDRYQDVPCLILDDVGAAAVTEWGLSQMFQLLDSRCKSQRQTIFTSNYSPERLQQKLLKNGHFEEEQVKRLISRIVGMTHPFHLTGKDKRWDHVNSLFVSTSLERNDNNDKKSEEQSLFA